MSEALQLARQNCHLLSHAASYVSHVKTSKTSLEAIPSICQTDLQNAFCEHPSGLLALSILDAHLSLCTMSPCLSVHGEHASCCTQVYEGTWLGQVVAIKVLDGAAAASQKAMKEVRQCIPLHAHPYVHGVLYVCSMSTGHAILEMLTWSDIRTIICIKGLC